MPRLCLFDASGYIHRAFHAIPPLTTSKGEPVNAVYGFARMISKVLKDEKPEYVGVCFDAAEKTFRHEQFQDYKATRKEIDATLISQLPLAEELAIRWGLPCIKAPGFEADDIIATLTRMAREKGIEVLILSGDKDILQLVEDGHIRARDEVRKVEFDSAQVAARYGVIPSRLLDLLCLTGDKVDNVPGVPGVGEKTAARLLNDYGSIEGILAAADKESPALREKLLGAKDTLLRNRTLIRLDDHVPVTITLTDLKSRKPDAEALPPLLQRLEFKNGLYGIDDELYGSSAEVNTRRTVRTVLTPADLAELVAAVAAAPLVSFDLETDGLNTRYCGVVGVAISVKEHEAWYIPVAHRYMGAPAQLPSSEVFAALRPFLEDPKREKCLHNFKFDHAVLNCLGLTVAPPVFDTMIAAYCVDPSRNGFGLKDIAADLLNEKMTRIDALIGKGKAETFDQVPVEAAAPYAAADAEVVLRLVPIFRKKLEDAGLMDLFRQLEMPLVGIIQDMEAAGIAVDVPHLESTGREFSRQRLALEEEIFGIAGERFTLNSPKQLARILFEKLKLPAGRKTKTGFSTDEEVLRKLAPENPICDKIIACRELAKLGSTYVDALLAARDPQTGRIHTSFHQTGTTTGRLSSSDPNLQNIPIRSENGRIIRRAFVAEPGSSLVSADYSQIDLRSLAHITGDDALIRTFQTGGDVHAATAAEIFHVPLSDVTPDQRRGAKAINFGIVYGQQAFALSQALGVEIAVARDFIAKYFERYAGVKAWLENTLVLARKNGFITTVSGRRRPVPDINSTNAFTRGFAERVAMNTPIQGTSADVIKYAMIRVQNDLKTHGMKTRMLLQVHDELVFEVPESERSAAIPLIQNAMEGAYAFRVPLVVDMKAGTNWNDMTKLVLESVR